MTLFNGTYLRSFLQNLQNCKILQFFRSHNNNNINNWLPSKISGWLANPGGKRLKPIEEISQEELYACLYVFTNLRGLEMVHL